MAEFLSTPLGFIVALAAGVSAVGVIWRQAIRPVVHGTRRAVAVMEKVEGQTRQLSPNGGSHMRDDITAIRLVVEKQTQDMETVKAALEMEQRKVRDDLDTHRRATTTEFAEVWRTIATRDIHVASDHLIQAAERAERAQPNQGDNPA
jgi:hypothetical protein